MTRARLLFGLLLSTLAISAVVAQSPHAGSYSGTIFATVSGVEQVNQNAFIIIEGSGSVRTANGLSGTVSGATITWVTPNSFNFASSSISNNTITATSTAPISIFTYRLSATRLDGSGAWTRITAGLPANLANPIFGAGNGNTLYFGAGSGGIYRSTDNGVTWAAVNTGLTGNSGEILTPRALFRTSGGAIVRGGDTASFSNRVGSPVWYSDNGTSWTEATFPFSTPSTAPGGTVGFVDFTEFSGALYASDVLSSGVWKSTTRGQTWAGAGSGLPALSVAGFTIVKTNGIAAQGGALIAATDLQGMYRSSDGAMWQAANSGIVGTNSTDVVAMLDGSAAYAVVTGLLFKTTNGGAAWTQVSPTIFHNNGTALLGQASAIATTSTAVYVFSNLGRIGESTDGGATWLRLETASLPAIPPGGFETRFYAHNGFLYFGSPLGVYRANLTTIPRLQFPPQQVIVPASASSNVGNRVALTVQVVGGSGTFTYQWRKNGADIPTGTGPTYTINSLQQGDVGTYSVVVGNNGGSVTSSDIAVSILPVGVGYPDLSFDLADTLNLITGREIGYRNGQILGMSDLAVANNVVLLNANGSIDAAWAGATVYPQGEPTAVAVNASGEIFVAYVGSTFAGSADGGPFLQKLLPDGRPDPGFRAPFTGNTQINAIAFQSDGKILVGGNLFRGTEFYHIARLQASGAMDLGFTTFVNSGMIEELHVLPDNSFWAVGAWARNTTQGWEFKAIRKFLPNGQEDSAYVSPFATNSSANAMAVDAAGNIYLAGRLSSHDTQTVADRVVRLNSSGTVIDSSFGTQTVTANSSILAIAVQADGKLISGGLFTQFAGTTAWGLVRLTASGALDSSFPNGQHLNETGLNRFVDDVLVLPEGDIMVSGTFAAFDGYQSPGLIRLIGDPVSLAFTSEPVEQNVAAGGTATFTATAVGTAAIGYQWHKNGVPLTGKTSPTLTINGVSTAAAGDYSVAISTAAVGPLTSRAAALRILGKPIIVAPPQHVQLGIGESIRLAVQAVGLEPLSYQWFEDGAILNGKTERVLTIAAAAAANAGLYTVQVTNGAGTTTSAEAQVTVLSPADATIPNLNIGTGANGPVTDSLNVGNRFYICGTFTQVNGVARPGLARLHLDGSLDTTFAPVIPEVSVSTVAVAADGSIFVAAGNGNTNYTIRKLHAAGTAAADFTPFGVLQFSAHDMALQNDGKIIVGGSFQQINNDTSLAYLIRLHANGTLDTAFHPPVLDRAVRDIDILSDGRIMIAGDFHLSANNRNSYYIAILNPDGTRDISFDNHNNLPNTFGFIPAAEVVANGKILVFGGFQTFGTAPYQGGGRLNANGATDTTFVNPGIRQVSTNSGAVTSFIIHPAGYIVVGGGFDRVGNANYNRIGALTLNGGLVVDFNPTVGGAGSSVATLAMAPTGTILVGNSVNGYTILAGWPANLAIVASPADTVADPGTTVNLTVETFSLTPPTIQWQKNGENILGATGSTLTLTAVTVANNGDYRAVVSLAGETQYSDVATLIVLDAPIITQPPVSQTIDIGKNVTFTAAALGLAPLSYRWTKNGQEIPGVTGTTLTLTAVTPAAEGEYRFVATNNLNTATSAPATLVVRIPPADVDPGFVLGATPNQPVQAVYIDDDGRVLVGGSFTNLAGDQRLTRYLANGAIDPAFTANVDGAVLAIAVQPDGKILIGGSFTQIDSQGRAYVARLNDNGALDTGFNAGQTFNQTNGQIVAIGLQANGSIVVGGYFTEINDVARNYIARLNSNGTLDTTFTVGSGFNAQVEGLAVLPDDRIAVVGSFSAYNGATSNRIVLLKADGERDSGFAIGTGFNGTAYAIEATRDGKFVVGGQFGTFNGAAAASLARLNANGTIDSSFAVGADINAAIQDLRVRDDGGVVIVGDFTSVRGKTRNRIAAVSANGTLDENFDPGAGFNAQGTALDIRIGGEIVVGGQFTQYTGQARNYLVQLYGNLVPLVITDDPTDVAVDAGGDATFTVAVYTTSPESYQWQRDGEDIPGETTNTLTLTDVELADEGLYRVVVQNADDTRTSAAAELRVLTIPEVDFTPQAVSIPYSGVGVIAPIIVGAGAITYQWYLNGTIVNGATGATLAIAADSIAKAGFYAVEATNTYGTTLSQAIAVRFNSTPGSVDSSFALGTGFSNSVQRILVLSDGDILVGGNFGTLRGVARSALARLNPDGSLDETFNNTNGLGGGAVVYGLTELANGQVLVSGFFSSYAGTNINGNIIRLNRDGTRDITFTAPQPPFGGQISSIVVQADGKIVTIGSFTGGIRRLNANGTLDGTFQSNDSSNQIFVAHALSNGKLLIAGSFTSIGPTSATVNKRFLAVLNADGTVDGNFTAGLPQTMQRVDVVKILPDAKIVVAAADSSFRPIVYRLLADGSLDNTWTPTAIANEGINLDIVVETDGSVILSGSFSFIAGTTQKYITRLTPTGSIDTTFMAGVTAPSDVVNSVARDASGRILVGGSFTTLGSVSSSRLARLLGAAPATVSLVGVTPSQNILEGQSITLEAVAFAPATATYQWYSGATGNTANPIGGATQVSYTTPILTATASYWVRVNAGAGNVFDSNTIVIRVISPPQITVNPAAITLNIDATAPNLLTGVTAADYELTDITGSILVSVSGAGFVNTAVPGTYTVTYRVADAGGRNATPRTRVYTVVDNILPEITVDPAELTVLAGFSQNVRAGVTASDNFDGDLTSHITVSGDLLNVNVVGTYTIHYSVTDASGNPAVQRTRLYHVIIDRIRPVLTAGPRVVVLAKGVSLNPAPNAGFSASDNFDGDLAAFVVVSGDVPDTNVPGIYVVRYTVHDQSGNQATATRAYRIENTPTTDIDNDSLDDDWERTHLTGASGSPLVDLRWNGNDDADGDGIDNRTEFQMGTDPRGYGIHLRRGWNFVSLFHLPADRSVAAVLAHESGSPVYSGSVWGWNAQTQNYQPTTMMAADSAVWVFVPEETTVMVELD